MLHRGGAADDDRDSAVGGLKVLVFDSLFALIQ